MLDDIMNNKYILFGSVIFIVCAAVGVAMLHNNDNHNITPQNSTIDENISKNNSAENFSIGSEDNAIQSDNMMSNVKQNVKNDKKNLISKNQAINIAKKSRSNKIKVTSVELEKDHDLGYVWNIDFDDKSGFGRVKINAESGKVIGTVYKADDDNPFSTT